MKLVWKSRLHRDLAAAVFAALLAVLSQIAIPMHYNTFPVIKADPQAFKARVEAETPTKFQVLKAFDVFEV